MNIFGSNDVIFARATAMGREILNVRLCGISSMDALMGCIKAQMGSFFGIAKINVRNLTQGWSQSSAYRIA